MVTAQDKKAGEIAGLLQNTLRKEVRFYATATVCSSWATAGL